jgi:hypothetical protein
MKASTDPNYERKKAWRAANIEKTRKASRDWKRNAPKRRRSSWAERRAAILACVDDCGRYRPKTRFENAARVTP